MTEYLREDGGGEDKEIDGDGPLGPVGKSVARRERRLGRDQARYDRLHARRGRILRSDADLTRWQDEQNELLVLEERLGSSGRDPYADDRAEGIYNPDDAVPEWLRRQWATKAATGNAALGLAATADEVKAGLPNPACTPPDHH